MNVVKRHTLYPIADEDALGLPAGLTRATTRALWTGETRPPKRGEWYLSGAVVEAYRAPSDLTWACRIATLVAGRMVWDRPVS